MHDLCSTHRRLSDPPGEVVVWGALASLLIAWAPLGCESPRARGDRGQWCLPGRVCNGDLVCSEAYRCGPPRDNLCADVDCGGVGACVDPSPGSPMCLCSIGYHDEGGACVTDDASAPCRGVTCQGHGTCTVVYGAQPICECEPGYHQIGPACLPNDPADPCLGVGCAAAGVGRCVVEAGLPACVCEQGHTLVGTSCYPAHVDRWQRQDSADSPPNAQDMKMVYDDARDRVVLLRLATAGSIEEVLTTWEYDGQRWTQRALTTHPPPRYHFGLAYDQRRRRTVLFGGVHAETWDELDDTWEYDGQRWTQIHTPHAPSPRREVAMTHAPGQGGVLLFGGRCSYGDFCQDASGEPEEYLDTWTYDGTDWSLVSTAGASDLASPHPHPLATMAHHAGLQRVVMLAHGSPTGGAFRTWHFDGLRWEPQGDPGVVEDWVALGEPVVAWEPSRARLLAVGRTLNACHTLAYDPDGAHWDDLWPAWTPPYGQGYTLVTDTARRRLVFLVWGVPPYREHTETWIFRSASLFSVSPPPSGGAPRPGGEAP